jgi:hypothetical protein
MTDTKKAVGPQALAQLEEQELEALAQQLAGRLEAPLETERRRHGAGVDLAVTVELSEAVTDAVVTRAEDILGERGWVHVAVARRLVGRPALMVLARAPRQESGR